LARTPILAEALDAFESDLQIHVANRCKDSIFVHAGVVAWQGRAIVFPGLSGSGKTSLVAALLERGATYYSDEYAVVDRYGRVHPYARPLNIKLAKGGFRRKYQPELFGKQPIPIGLVVITRYQENGRWQPRTVTGGRAVLALINNTVSIRRQPRAALSTLCRAIAGVRAVESVRGEASQIAPLILTEME
jgi:hypothetical protein